MSVEGTPPERLPAQVTFARRKWVIDALCEAYARDQLTVEELEHRLDRANRVRTLTELDALLEPLDLSGWSAEAQSATILTPSERGGSPATAEEVPGRQLVVAIWSGANRQGRWIPARRLTATAIQGGVELDFREAMLVAGVYEVRAIALMGGIQIIVPPGLSLDTSGFALMGGFRESPEGSPPPAPDGPVLRIRGFALMGGIDIDVRLPGESAGEARQRRRRERRKRR
jgi:hypothetical protein